MKKILFAAVFLLLISCFALAYKGGGIVIFGRANEGIIYVDNNAKAFMVSGRQFIAISPGSYEILIKTKHGREIYRKRLTIEKNKRVVINVH